MRTLLSLIALASLTATAAATPVRIRSTDGCYDLISFQFTIAAGDIVDPTDKRILAIPEPALFNHPDAHVQITVELGPYAWPADYKFPDRLAVASHQPRPFYTTDRGRWYVWDAYNDNITGVNGYPELYQWGIWTVGERVNIQAVVPSGQCHPGLNTPFFLGGH